MNAYWNLTCNIDFVNRDLQLESKLRFDYIAEKLYSVEISLVEIIPRYSEMIDVKYSPFSLCGI